MTAIESEVDVIKRYNRAGAHLQPLRTNPSHSTLNAFCCVHSGFTPASFRDPMPFVVLGMTINDAHDTLAALAHECSVHGVNEPWAEMGCFLGWCNRPITARRFPPPRELLVMVLGAMIAAFVITLQYRLTNTNAGQVYGVRFVQFITLLVVYAMYSRQRASAAVNAKAAVALSSWLRSDPRAAAMRGARITAAVTPAKATCSLISIQLFLCLEREASLSTSALEVPQTLTALPV